MNEPLSIAEWASAIAMGVNAVVTVLLLLLWRRVRPPKVLWP
jgi:uncharacterized protein YqfA (UPF0365 family)